MTSKVLTKSDVRFAWIEYGHPGDGKQFCAALTDLGLRNAFLDLPLATDSAGKQHRVDAAHPLLPVRFVGNALLALPNDVVETTRAVVDDPLFRDYVAQHGRAAFDAAIRDQNNFLSRWAFVPGLRRVDDGSVELTTDADADVFCDLVAVSGHGSSGAVWGGGQRAHLGGAATTLGARPNDQLKYLIVPSCFNLYERNAPSWLPMMRNPKPLRAILGYSRVYVGDSVGPACFKRFGQLLKRGKTILRAWQEANEYAGMGDRWGALFNAAAEHDTLADWLGGTLTPLDPDGELLCFSGDNPEGFNPNESPPAMEVFFVQTPPEDFPTRVTRLNANELGVGLFPGEQGRLELVRNDSWYWLEGEKVRLRFYYYRADKDKMDLDKLLTVTSFPQGTYELLKDSNKLDSTTYTDGLELTISGRHELIWIEYTVHPQAHLAYPEDGTNQHGYFWIAATKPDHWQDGVEYSPETEPTNMVYLYTYGACLRVPGTRTKAPPPTEEEQAAAALPQLFLHRLECAAEQAWEPGDDEVYLQVDGQTVWGPKAFATGTAHEIDLGPREFDESVSVELWEADSGFSDDDALGALRVELDARGQGQRSHSFTRGGATYILTYEVR